MNLFAFQIKQCYLSVKETLYLLKEMDLIVLNKIYVNYSDTIDPLFMTNSTEQYGVQVEKISFIYPKAATSFINRWVI